VVVDDAGSLPTQEQLAMLFTFRRAVLSFLKWSEHRLRRIGLTPQQYLLLLAVRVAPEPPRVGMLADELLIAGNSALELVGRAEALGLVQRARDPADQRAVRVSLTGQGEALIGELAADHLAELERAALALGITEEFLGALAAAYLPASLETGQESPH
jgi:DNA-binding MarR family transcriptional regulator